MNSPKPLTEIVRDENKEKTMASIPHSTDIQEASSTFQPGTSPNDTKSNNDDDEVNTTAHRASVASRFQNTLLSPNIRQSTGKNIGGLKRPAEVTPVPSSTIAAKRSRHVNVTPKRIAKLATDTVPASNNNERQVKRHPKSKAKAKTNFYQSVYDLVEQSTVENPELIRWRDDGKAFVYDETDKVKLTQFLGKFGLPKWESFRRRLNIYGFQKAHKKKELSASKHELFHRGLNEADIDCLYQCHVAAGPVRSKANKEKKAVASTPTRVTTMVVTASKKAAGGPMRARANKRKKVVASTPTRVATMVVTASKKALKKSPVVENMDSAAVNPKPSRVNGASERLEVAMTPLKFTAEMVAQSNDSGSVTTPVAVKHPTSYSPGDWSCLPLGVLTDTALGYSQAGSLPFDSEVESAAAGGASFAKQVSSAPFFSPTGCIPVEWSPETALGLDHFENALSFDARISPCKSTKKASAVGLTLDYAQDSVASPAAGILLANLTHDQGILIKMSFANGVSAFSTSPVHAAVLTATSDVDVFGRLVCMESVQDPSTPPVSAASRHDCPATPLKWSGEQLSAFSPIFISAGKGPCPTGTASQSLMSLRSITLALRLGELANLSDDELLVGQVEAV